MKIKANAELYKKLAKYYDLIYSFKNYIDETECLRTLIHQYKKSPGNTLLDVACGTGKHLAYLKNEFQCVGTDLNEEMLSIARKQVDNVEFIHTDMITMRLQNTFDILICMFSSIAYVKTYENLARTLESFALHLKPGGVAIIEPWYTKELFIQVGYPPTMTCENKNLKITRKNKSSIKGNLSVVDIDFSVIRNDTDVEYYKDQHQLAMFEPEKILILMQQYGLNAHFLQQSIIGDRGLYIGIKNQ